MKIWKGLPIFILGLLVPQGLQAQDPVGMVLQLRGEGSLTRQGEQKPPRLAELLQVGDELAVQSGELLFLFCPSSERITLEAGGRARLNADGIQVLKGGPLGRSKARCALPKVALGVESLERVGGLRARGYPPISLYLGGTISTDRPSFRWAPVAEAEVFQITLRDDDLGRVLWEAETTTPEILYPDSKAPLQEKRYRYEVTARAAGQIVAQQSAGFQVKLDPMADSSPPEDVAGKLVRATELENLGYYSEAAAYFRQLRESMSEDERITRRLAWLYWNAGLITSAEEEKGRVEAPPNSK